MEARVVYCILNANFCEGAHPKWLYLQFLARSPGINKKIGAKRFNK